MDLEKIDAYNSQQKEEAQRQEELSTIAGVGDKVEKAVEYSTAKLISDRKVNPQKVKVLNDIATANDIAKVVSALDKLAIVLKPEPNDDSEVVSAMDRVYQAIQEIPKLLPQTPDPVEDVTVTNITEIQKYIQPLVEAIDKLELNPIFDPRIEVKPADVKIATEKVDTEPLLRALESLGKEVTKLTLKEQPVTDILPLVEATRATTKAINGLQFPVPNYILPFKDINGKAVQVQLDASGNVPTSGGSGSTTVDTGQKDVFNQQIIGTRNNQVEIDYSSTDPDAISLLTITKTNGGDAANSVGQAVYSTSTNTNGEIKAVTTRNVTYHPHSETYVAFTAIFTSGIANSYQRIGLYDDNNGFFIGYEGTSFGITKRSGGVDSTVAQASFSNDTLTGQASSGYTRSGIAEAADFTKDNLFRIRFGWLGAAPIYFEILNPDGEWIIFHTIKHPNTVSVPSIQNPNLPIRLHIKKTTAGATNLIVSTACWAAGSSSNLQKITETLYDETLAQTTRSVITGVTTGGGGGYVNVKVNPSGALTVDSTISGAVTAYAKPSEQYAISNKEATATYKYFGFQRLDGYWYIMRKTLSTNVFEYVSGTSAYSTAWTNRASQTYTDYATAF
jgi:hypothetical protein